MVKTTTAIRLGPQGHEWIQAYADFLGISFSQSIREAALEKLEDTTDAQDYSRTVKEDGGVRYTIDEIARRTLADRRQTHDLPSPLDQLC